MTYREIKGNLFNSAAQALANTVNCVGVMGKGIALEFRRRYPEMFEAYRRDCEDERLSPGRIYYYPTKGRLILNITTKRHWRYPSRMEWIESALGQFVREYREKDIRSVAFPLLGAESGKLRPQAVRGLMRRYLQPLVDIEIEVYEFDPSASDPLFELLTTFASEPDAIERMVASRIRREVAERILSSVQGGRVRSMAALSDLASERMIDRLYELLRKVGTGSRGGRQLSLFE